MTTIYLGVGQCGNQISSALIDQILASQTQQTSYLYTHFDDKLHFINIDSEAKVISTLATRHAANLRSENLLNTRCGRGSNWASGYAGLEKDGAGGFMEDCIDAVRKESERCDFVLGFNLMHSLSGGTGSGCGSKAMERLREEFGCKKYLFSQSVAPFASGELPLQHYNNLLCLAHLQENDDVYDIVEKTSSSEAPTKRANEHPGQISLIDMNTYIARSLLGLLLPVDSVSLKTQSFGLEPYELQRLLCPNPALKFIEIYNINGTEPPSTTRTTNANPLLKTLINQIPKYDTKGAVNKQFVTVNALMVSRGSGVCSSLATLWNDMDVINKCLNPVKWNPFVVDFWSAKNGVVCQGNNKSKVGMSLSVAVNRNKCVELFENVRDRSAEKFVKKAYLEWFRRFGVEDEMFIEAFKSIQSVIDSYDMMTSI